MWIESEYTGWDCEYPDGCYAHISNGTIICMYTLKTREGVDVVSGHVTRRGRSVDEMRQSAIDIVTQAWKDI